MLVVDGVTGPLDPLVGLPLPQLDGQAAALLQHGKTLRVSGQFTFHQVHPRGPHIDALMLHLSMVLMFTILRLNVRKYINHNFQLFLWNPQLWVSRMLPMTTWKRQFGMI